MPKVSVVVATYRRDTVLQRALESLTTQTYDDFEIILVNDNDNQEWNEKVNTITEAFQIKHPDIKLKYIINNPNKGSAQTRNIGIHVSEGEYICFLDDDDIYCPDRIKNQLFPMQEKKADYSITNLALFLESEKLVEVRNREYLKENTPEQLLKYHLMYHMTGTDTMMFRREYLMKIGCFSPIDVGDEFYLMQKAIEGGGTFLHVPVCDVKAYVHTGEEGLSSGNGKIIGENQLFEHKKKYFNKLDKKAVKYIKMRHYVVLAYACLRMRKYLKFLLYGTRGFLISPVESLQLLIKR